VILVDANLLVYASVKTFTQHTSARQWLDERLNGSARVGLPWMALLGFLRVTTNPRIFTQPLPMSVAWEHVEAWLGCGVAWTPEPTPRHRDLLGRLLALPGIRGNLVRDAHLAALAIEHGLILCSTDGDFAQFADLRWINPLQ
jgi:toxin-antitoxin system PIN domain toxin